MGYLCHGSACHAQDWDWLFDDPSLPSVISLHAGHAQPDLYNRALSLDMDITERHLRLQLYFSDVQSDAQEIQSRDYILGISTDPLKRWSWQLEGEYWGQNQAMISRGLKLGGAFQNSNWQLQLALQQRQIELYTDTTLQRVVELDSPGTHLSVQYFGFPSWMLQFNHSQQRYSRDTSALTDPRLAQFFSFTTLSLASGLEEQRSSISANYTIGAHSIGLRHQRGVSAIDQSLALSNELLYSWNNRNWGIALQSGWQKYDSDNTRYWFNHLSLSKYF